MHSLTDSDVEVGHIRETFFMSQILPFTKLNASAKADFLVNGKFLVEVGGKSKQQRQIAGVKNGFVVKDDIVIGNDNIIPLWLFGFLY
jgi:hypothetical protein